MPETTHPLAVEIGSKLTIDDRKLRPAFFDDGSPLESGPLASKIKTIAEGREPLRHSLATAPIGGNPCIRSGVTSYC